MEFNTYHHTDKGSARIMDSDDLAILRQFEKDAVAETKNQPPQQTNSESKQTQLPHLSSPGPIGKSNF